MLVKLYNVAPDDALSARLTSEGIIIKRALAPDARRIIRFVERSAGEHWPQESMDSWIGECEAALSQHPPTCFIAVRDGDVLGFACYDATAKGFFGPTGVLREAQGHGVGKALLLASLLAMWDEGYGYAVIGSPAAGAIGFYEKTVDAEIIEDSSPGIYRRMIDG
jgi:GNAT superfamily N-acetyltransferase